MPGGQAGGGEWTKGGGGGGKAEPLVNVNAEELKQKPITLVFSGSFNPPGSHHEEALRRAQTALRDQGYNVRDTVVVPSPDRLMRKKLGPGAYPLDARVELAKRQFGEGITVTGEPSKEAEKIEGKLRRTDTARWMREHYPGTEVVTVTGHGDAAGYPEAKPPEGSIALYKGAEGTNHAGFYYLTLPRPEGGLSSTKIRAALARGEQIPENVLRPETQAYLKEQVLPQLAEGIEATTVPIEGAANNPWVGQVLEDAKAVAKSLKFDPDQISTTQGVRMFTLNDKDYLTAGLAHFDTGKIELFPWVLSSPISTRKVTAHEVMHQKYATFMKNYLYESRLMMQELREGLATGRFREQRLLEPMRPDGTLDEPLASKYPLYQAYTKLFNKHSITDAFSKSDGVSEYSKDWWEAWKKGQANTEQALHETLAEMAAEEFNTGTVPGAREWKQLYRMVGEHWRDVERRRKRQARQERVWQSSAS